MIISRGEKMITRADLFLLLGELEDDGIDTKEQLLKLSRANGIDIDVIKFINDHRELSLTKFYEKIRKSYNNKKSKLYINIVKEKEDLTSVITTLSALLTQAILFSKDLEDKEIFFKHARCDEISKAITTYFATYNLIPCIKLIKLIKADIKALEHISR